MLKRIEGLPVRLVQAAGLLALLLLPAQAAVAGDEEPRTASTRADEGVTQRWTGSASRTASAPSSPEPSAPSSSSGGSGASSNGDEGSSSGSRTAVSRGGGNSSGWSVGSRSRDDETPRAVDENGARRAVPRGEGGASDTPQ